MARFAADTASRNLGAVRRLDRHSLLEIVMPETRHEREAEKILGPLSPAIRDAEALLQSRRLLAEALENAEQRGRRMSARQKESSG